jgi:plastocyanin
VTTIAHPVRRPPVSRFVVFFLSSAILLTAALPGKIRAEGQPSQKPSGAAASLQGRITVGPELISRKVRFSLYPDVNRPQVAPPAAPADEIRNVVVYLQGPALPEASAIPHPAYRMEQRDESFVPHVLAVPRGASVEFPNSDPIFHNVFSLSHASSFDLGRYPRGSSRSVRFDEPGIVKVFCHIHADMSAVILVLDTPLFTVPDGSGEYGLSGIPPGDYTVIAWHERARPIRRTVTLRAGEETRLDFSIPLQDAPFDR